MACEGKAKSVSFKGSLLARALDAAESDGISLGHFVRGTVLAELEGRKLGIARPSPTEKADVVDALAEQVADLRREVAELRDGCVGVFG